MTGIKAATMAPADRRVNEYRGEFTRGHPWKAINGAIGGLVFRPARHIAELAAASRLPAFHGNPTQVGDAGLILCAANLDVVWRRASAFVDKILRGALPADLPVEPLAKFNLVIKLKTAKAIGLEITQALLFRADEVIH